MFELKCNNLKLWCIVGVFFNAINHSASIGISLTHNFTFRIYIVLLIYYLLCNWPFRLCREILIHICFGFMFIALITISFVSHRPNFNGMRNKNIEEFFVFSYNCCSSNTNLWIFFKWHREINYFILILLYNLIRPKVLTPDIATNLINHLYNNKRVLQIK